MPRSRAAEIAALVLAAAACKPERPAPETAEPRTMSAAPPPAPRTEDARAPEPPPPQPKALAGTEPIVSLAVPGFGDAVVSLPLGATTRRPLVIAAHGNYDRPEWQCEVWRDVVGDRAFVLCPRGVPRSDSPSKSDVRFTYETGAAFTKETDHAVDALRERYGDFLDEGPVLFVGFSLGAILGVPYILRDPARFPRAVLVEGGDLFGAATLKSYASKGGQRVLLGCGQAGCVGEAKAIAARLERAGLRAKAVYGAGVGHGYGGAVADAIKRELAWLVEGDPRWGGGENAPVPGQP